MGGLRLGLTRPKQLSGRSLLSTRYLRQPPPLVYVSHCYSLYAPTNIFNSMQTESGDDQDVVDFFDIPMDGIQETDELDEYLSQAIEKVRDPIAWWWDHQKAYPRLSAMALDYLSIPGTCLLISMQLLS